jgi:GNAT superfamily N-acetyltransferase
MPDELLDNLSVAEREARWRELIGDSERHWLNLVAEDDGGDLAGFCAVTTSGQIPEDGEPPAEVGALYVDPPRWREGAGSALLTAALESLKERGWQEVTLWALPQSTGALAFYKRLGFEVEEGVEKPEPRSGLPVIRLRADLQPR